MSSLQINPKLIKKEYSSAETKIGIWINGKDLYRKVITFTSTAGTLISAEIDDVVFTNCQFKESSGAWRPIPWLFYNTASALVFSWLGGYYITSTGNLVFQVGPDLGNIQKGIFIIEYTKK